MPILPFAVATVTALVLAPALRASLAEGGFVRENYRGDPLPFPFGVAVVAAAAVALVPLALVYAATDEPLVEDTPSVVLTFVLGVAALGLADDALSGPSRGWRGHGAAVMKGSFSTGALKAAGSLGLAFFVLAGRYDDPGRYLLAVTVLVLATNLFNLIDLRPGRSAKLLVLLGAGLTIGTWDAGPLAALGLLAFPALALGIYDLRERAMLGDTGSNLMGALGGLWIVLSLDTTGQLVALALIALATVYGEFRSLGALIERTPILRQLDSFGRPTHA